MRKKRTISRIMCMAVSLCMAIGLIAGIFPFAASADAPQVQLYSAQTKFDTIYNSDGTFSQYFYIEGYVCIESSSATQAVTLHYSRSGGSWTDVLATYVCNDPDGYEVWYFKSTPYLGRENGNPHYVDIDWDFCLKYVINGTTYWDSNGGNNYNLRFSEVMATPVPYVLNKSAIAQKDATHAGTVFSGSVVLKNLAYSKNVIVRYTTNNWATYTDVSLSYSASHSGNLETWNFSASIPSGATVKYCYCYTVNGVSYWDNNFGRNYTL